MATTEIKYQINGVTVTAVLNVKGGVQYAFGETDGTKIRNQFLVTVMNGTRLASFLFYDSIANFEARKNKLTKSGLRNALECFLLDAMAAREANFRTGSYVEALRNFAKEQNFDMDLLSQSVWLSTKKEKEQVQRLKDTFKGCEEINRKLEGLGLYEAEQHKIFDAIREEEEKESDKKYNRKSE